MAIFLASNCCCYCLLQRVVTEMTMMAVTQFGGLGWVSDGSGTRMLEMQGENGEERGKCVCERRTTKKLVTRDKGILVILLALLTPSTDKGSVVISQTWGF